MMEKKNILPIGSAVSVKYAVDGGKETVLIVVGHLSLRKDTLCFYDYICVPFPEGAAKGLCYINHDDVVRVIHLQQYDSLDYSKWLERKYAEYEAYYKHYRFDERESIDEQRKRTVQGINAYERKREAKKVAGAICLGGIIIGAVAVAFLTKEWETAVCALLFAVMGYLIK